MENIVFCFAVGASDLTQSDRVQCSECLNRGSTALRRIEMEISEHSRDRLARFVSAGSELDRPRWKGGCPRGESQLILGLIPFP